MFYWMENALLIRLVGLVNILIKGNAKKGSLIAGHSSMLEENVRDALIITDFQQIH